MNEICYKDYFVDQSIIAKESHVLADKISSSCFSNCQINSHKIVLKDTSFKTFEAFISFCKTGFIPMSAIDKKLALFVDEYRVENLRNVLDKHVSMILDADNVHEWIDLATKMELKNTAFAIMQLKLSKNGPDYFLCEGNNTEFARFINKLHFTSAYPAFGKFHALNHSGNIMVD